MDTKSHKLTDARREMFYAELHALLTAGLDFSAAFRLLIEGEGDRRTKAPVSYTHLTLPTIA